MLLVYYLNPHPSIQIIRVLEFEIQKELRKKVVCKVTKN